MRCSSELGEDDLKITATRAPAPTVSEAELFEWCIDELPYFALPRYIEFRDELPRSPVGPRAQARAARRGRDPVDVVRRRLRHHVREAMTAFLLIHGGNTTGRFWDRLVPCLPGPVLAVDLPGRGAHPLPIAACSVDRGSTSVLSDVEAWDVDDDIVIVAHSSGGLFTPGVVTGLHGRVREVVLNAASVPPEGGGGIDCMKARHREGLELAMKIARDSGHPSTPARPRRTRPRIGMRTAAGRSPTKSACSWPTRCAPSPTASTSTSTRCTGRSSTCRSRISSTSTTGRRRRSCNARWQAACPQRRPSTARLGSHPGRDRARPPRRVDRPQRSIRDVRRGTRRRGRRGTASPSSCRFRQGPRSGTPRPWR